MKSLTPIIRMFDEDKAKAFYVDYLGFAVDWEHRFGSNFPLYMQVSKGGIKLHLSEHHGDCCPGAALRIEVEGIEQFHAALASKDYKYAKPGLERTPWNSKEVCIMDPFGNRIIFYENVTD